MTMWSRCACNRSNDELVSHISALSSFGKSVLSPINLPPLNTCLYFKAVNSALQTIYTPPPHVCDLLSGGKCWNDRHPLSQLRCQSEIFTPRLDAFGRNVHTHTHRHQLIHSPSSRLRRSRHGSRSLTRCDEEWECKQRWRTCHQLWSRECLSFF